LNALFNITNFRKKLIKPYLREIGGILMKEKISLCGFNCGICPGYKDNLKTDKNRKLVDEGWKKFHRTSGWIYKEPYCEGCFNIPEKAPLWSRCPIRRCVLTNNVENCGYCPDYPCPRIENMIYVTKKIATRTRKSGTKDDFKKFALPYLGEQKLEEINKQFITTIQNIEFQPVNTHTVKFPQDLNLETHIEPEKFIEALQYLHSTLESISTLHWKTPGGREQELKRNKETLKFLWIIGRYGELITNNGEPLIEITAEKIKKILKYGKYRTTKKLQELVKHGIESNSIEDKITIKFSKKPDTAIAFQEYIKKLLKNISERKAYSKFWKADMTVFK